MPSLRMRMRMRIRVTIRVPTNSHQLPCFPAPLLPIRKRGNIARALFGVSSHKIVIAVIMECDVSSKSLHIAIMHHTSHKCSQVYTSTQQWRWFQSAENNTAVHCIAVGSSSAVSISDNMYCAKCSWYQINQCPVHLISELCLRCLN